MFHRESREPWFPARKRQVARKDVLVVGRPELGCRHMIVIVVVDDSILQTSIMISEAVLAR
jgi:hypothetical protein